MTNETTDERLSLRDYERALNNAVRPGYLKLRVRDWTRDECLHWLWHVGSMDCSYNYCETEGLREEVLLQKAAMGH